MRRFMVKVCGITNPHDARLAERLGADLIGLIFYRPSPRYLTKRQAAEIVSSLSPLTRRVGVFVDEPIESVCEIARRFRLDFVQLHGPLKMGDISFCRRIGLKIIQSYSITTAADWQRAAASKADLVLADNKQDQKIGGTGERFDWKLAGRTKISNLIIAGGINAANVEESIKRFNPLVVDVNSGVEKEPGIKSPKKLKEFFKICNGLRYGN